MLIFFKCNIKFERSIMSTPRMITFVTPKLKETFLNSFNDSKFFIIPLTIIFSHKESGKSFLRCPFNRNPFQSLRSSCIRYMTTSTYISIHHIRKMRNNLYWNFSVYIILNLFDWWVRSKLKNMISIYEVFELVDHKIVFK